MGIASDTLSYEQYCRQRYFEPLDGLRAFSILAQRQSRNQVAADDEKMPLPPFPCIQLPAPCT